MTSTTSAGQARARPLDESRLRPAGRATRAAIESAARDLFRERGFEGASVRAIAAAAGVDPALVIRHFGSKEALFLRSVDTTLGVGAVVDGPLETMGRRLVAYFIDPERTTLRQAYTALSQAAHLPHVREETTRHTAETYIGPLTPRLTGEHRELRAALAAAHLSGLLSMLFQQQDPHLTEADPEVVIALYGDAIQSLLTPPAD